MLAKSAFICLTGVIQKKKFVNPQKNGNTSMKFN